MHQLGDVLFSVSTQCQAADRSHQSGPDGPINLSNQNASVGLDSKWSSSGLLLYGSYFTTSSIEKKYRPVKEEPEKSSWLSTGYSQSLPWLCPKLREQHLGGSDSPIWFFFATATAVAKCMIITHNMMLTWWKNPMVNPYPIKTRGPSACRAVVLRLEGLCGSHPHIQKAFDRSWDPPLSMTLQKGRKSKCLEATSQHKSI